MVDTAGPRRTQFSSCDACRNSRLACDAARVGYDPGNKAKWTGSCSRCTRRKRSCTFEWIKGVKKPATQPRREKRAASTTQTQISSLSLSLSPETLFQEGHDGSAIAAEPASHHPFETTPRSLSSEITATAPTHSPVALSSIQPPLESVTAVVGEWLERVYEGCFEQIFGFWLGRDCCPFVCDPDCDLVYPPSRLFTELDADISEDWEARNLDVAPTPPAMRQDKDRLIDQSFSHAKRSFASQWLHLVPLNEPLGALHEDIVRAFWRASRRDMLKVINRVSYRSVLTLFLFGLTPIPIGISEEEEMDGLTGQICVQAALQQVQRLRERQRNCQFSGSKVSLASDTLASPPPNSDLSQRYLTSESRAYWGALTFDTSASLTLNFRSSLTSGLHGVTSESSWRVLRMGANSFHSRTAEWRKSTFEISDRTASEIIAAASAMKLYVWKTIAVLKEALREGDEEDKVQEAWSCFVEALELFQATFRSLLNACERRLPFLGQVERLNWYEVMLHYHLGVLMLVDAVEAAERTDLLSQLTEKRLDAEREVFNAIKFGLESTLTIYPWPRGDAQSVSELDTPSSDQSISATFVQIDPYPHHMVAGVQLMNKVVGREFRQGKIKVEAYRYLKSTLLKTLEQLPATSKSVQAARQQLHASMSELEGLSDKAVPTGVLTGVVQWPAQVF